jgi:hypothetical protein
MRISGLHTRPAGSIALAVCALAFGLAGCGSSANFSVHDLRRFVLTPSDLPSGYTLMRTRSGSAKDLVAGAQNSQQTAAFQQLAADKVKGFYSVEYHKSSGNNDNNPGSGALAFADSAEAAKALPLMKNLFLGNITPTGEATPTESSIPVSGLGDQAVPGIRYALGAGTSYALFFYIWRERNVDVFVGAANTLRDMTAQSLLKIAKQVNARGAAG